MEWDQRMTDRERAADSAPADEELATDERIDEADEAELEGNSAGAASSDKDTIVGPGQPSGPTAAGTAVGARGPRRPAPVARSSAPAVPPSGLAVHIDDRVSKVFVIGSVVVFVLILLNGVLLGSGGFLSATATPPPSSAASPPPTGPAPASGA